MPKIKKPITDRAIKLLRYIYNEDFLFVENSREDCLRLDKKIEDLLNDAGVKFDGMKRAAKS